jgi:hypothetical protein
MHGAYQEREKMMLTRIGLLLFAILLASCGGKAEPATDAAEGAEKAPKKEVSPAQALIDGAEFTKEGLYKIFKDPKAISETEYEALLLGIDKCDVTEETHILKEACPALVVLRKVHLIKEEDFVLAQGVNRTAIGERLFPTAGGKLKSYLIMNRGSLFGQSADSVKELLNIVKDDKDPVVIGATIRLLSNEMKKPEAAGYIFGHAKHEDAILRREAARAIGNSWSKGVEGAVEAIIELMKDADQKVRGAACAGAGKLADDQVIETITAILDNPEEHKIHSNCVDGLEYMWFQFPFHENLSEAAYNAQVAYFKKTPRSENIPAWNSVGGLRSTSDRTIEAWKKNATYFKPAEYLAVMTEIALDNDANWLGRTSAVDVIAKWGTVKQLEALGKQLDKMEGTHVKHVRDKVASKLKELAEAKAKADAK